VVAAEPATTHSGRQEPNAVAEAISVAGLGSIEGVVFDLDGTLVDSAPDIRTSLNLLLREIRRPPLALAEVTAMIGEGAETLVARALAATGGAPERDAVRALTRRFVALYEGRSAERTRPYPGVHEALAALRRAGLRLGICTNKPERATRALLQALALDRHFAAVVGGDSLDGVRKPDPRPVFAVLAALATIPARAVLIGDSRTDVAVARAAGVRVLVRRGGYTIIPADRLGADGAFDAFAELPALVRQLP
jgi:phosphoglycolate phosphatase